MTSLFPAPRHFVSVAVPRPLDGFFTYAVEDSMVSRVVPGVWVEIPFGRVDSRDGATGPRERTRDLSVTTPDVENPPEAREFLHSQRNDLFLVFGVDPVRESVDPPLRVCVPEGVVTH